MVGFSLLLGHLVGDYICQNDWMAANKVNPWPGREPHPNKIWLSAGGVKLRGEDEVTLIEQRAWWAKRRKWRVGHLACTVHCLLYTLSVWFFTWTWMPWWGLLACFTAHWSIDRFRLARLSMTRILGQKAFATGPLSPWSVIIVDNTYHLLTLWVITALTGRMT
jgi:hypothetical protein